MIVTVAELKEQMRVDFNDEDSLIERKITAAQNHIDRLLGFIMEDAEASGREGFEDGVPPALVECVSQLAAHWYENREASVVGDQVAQLPFGVEEIVREFRDYSFA